MTIHFLPITLERICLPWDSLLRLIRKQHCVSSSDPTVDFCAPVPPGWGASRALPPFWDTIGLKWVVHGAVPAHLSAGAFALPFLLQSSAEDRAALTLCSGLPCCVARLRIILLSATHPPPHHPSSQDGLTLAPTKKKTGKRGKAGGSCKRDRALCSLVRPTQP